MKQFYFNPSPEVGTYPLVIENGETIVELTFAYEDNKAIAYLNRCGQISKVAEFSNPTKEDMQGFFSHQSDFWSEYYVNYINYFNIKDMFKLETGERFNYYKAINNRLYGLNVTRESTSSFVVSYFKSKVRFETTYLEIEPYYYILERISSDLVLTGLINDYQDILSRS